MLSDGEEAASTAAPEETAATQVQTQETQQVEAAQAPAQGEAPQAE